MSVLSDVHGATFPSHALACWYPSMYQHTRSGHPHLLKPVERFLACRLRVTVTVASL